MWQSWTDISNRISPNPTSDDNDTKFIDYDMDGDQLTATDIRLGIPGAHPFTFILAKYHGDRLEPEPSSQLERPAIGGELLGVLWSRMTGSAEVLCLASLTLPPPGEGCT